MTRLPQPGGDDGTWGNVLNDFLSQAHNADGTLKPLSQAQIQNLTGDLASKANSADVVATTDLDTKNATLVSNAASQTSVNLKAVYATGEADYVITTDGTTITAKPRGGSGLTPYSGTDAYTVIQAAINALTPVGGGTGSAGGKIHITHGSYALSNELTIVGWENNVYNAMSQLVIEGDGWSTHFTQNTAGKNGIVIRNGASIAFTDFRISMGSSTKSAILGDDNGTDIEASLVKSYINNIHIDSNSTGYPAVYLKNFFYLEVPKLEVLATAHDGVLLENTSTTTNYGNSHFGLLHTRAGTTANAGLRIQTTQTTKFPNLITVSNYQCPSAKYGILLFGARFCSFDFVDIEGMAFPIYLDGNSSGIESRYNVIKAGYLFPSGTNVPITLTQYTGGNSFSLYAQLDTTAAPMADASSSFRPANTYNLGLSNNASYALVSVANPATPIVLRSLSGTVTTLPAVTATGIAAPTTVLATSDITPPAGVGNAKITAVGGGGGGGGGGAAALTSGVATQVGGSGGGAGQMVQQLVSVSGVTNIHVQIGTGGLGGAGGAASSGATGNAGSAAANSGTQSTIVTGTGISITAFGGSQGRGGGANSTGQVLAGVYGGQPNSIQSTTAGLAGSGGTSQSTSGSGGGSGIGLSGRGGGGGCPASATLGGVAGSALNGTGLNTTSAGLTPSAAPANTGQGGDGGGGGAPGGAGGNGGNGGSGIVLIEWLP
jgi:hypothetical protein